MLLTLILVVAGCTNSKRQMRRLAQIDSLMEKKPQAAYDSLCRNQKELTQGGVRQVEMRHRLLMAKAKNKLYKPMPSDSVFQDVVDYYDHKGTSNEKMEAHYLMGCIYRDQKEAPIAMKWYHQAVDCADTLSKDCDYETLFRIYGQMTDVYTKQNLWSEAIGSLTKYCNYAFKIGENAYAVNGLEKMAALYYNQQDTVKAMNLTKKCMELYNKYGMKQEAASVASLLCYIYVEKHEYGKAYPYMNTYEMESGLFDKDGNICPGREYYYYVKGLYYLGVNKLDSARIYFQKLYSSNYRYEANKGLLEVCGMEHDCEEVFKYLPLYEKEMDKVLSGNQANAVLQSTKMYDFQKMQKQMNEQELAKERLKNNILILILFAVFFGLLFLYILRRYKLKLRIKHAELKQKNIDLKQSEQLLEQSERDIESWNDKYLETLELMETYKRNFELFKDGKDMEIGKMQHKIMQLQGEIKQYENKIKRMSSSEKYMVIDDNKIYLKFKQKASGKQGIGWNAEKDWNALMGEMERKFPLFSDRIIHHKIGKILTMTELRVAILARLHFSNSEMANVLETSPASISNAKQAVNDKIFGEKNARTLLQNMLGMFS